MSGGKKSKRTSQNPNSVLVGVYGTLRLGYYNHGYISHCRCIGKYHTGPGYTKVVKGLPYLIKDDNGEGCELEVYEVDPITLNRLDKFEGSPDWYVRTKIKLDNLDVYVYLMPKERI